MQEAGADAVELNICYLPTDPAVDGASVEEAYASLMLAVCGEVSIPVAVKASPSFSATAAHGVAVEPRWRRLAARRT